MFKTISIQDPPQFVSNYFPLLIQFLRQPTCYYGGYLRGQPTLQLEITEEGPLNLTYKKFQALKETEKTQTTLTLSPRPQCMPAGYLRRIDAREYHRHRPRHNLNVAGTQTREVRQSLAVDNCCRSYVSKEEIEDCLDYPQVTPSGLQGRTQY